jgi:hypothetical protein
MNQCKTKQNKKRTNPFRPRTRPLGIVSVTVRSKPNELPSSRDDLYVSNLHSSNTKNSDRLEHASKSRIAWKRQCDMIAVLHMSLIDDGVPSTFEKSHSGTVHGYVLDPGHVNGQSLPSSDFDEPFKRRR